MKIMREWVTILLPIPEVSGLNLGPDTGYPEDFHGFPQPSWQMLGQNLKLGHDRFL
jgi:hypothetical protein